MIEPRFKEAIDRWVKDACPMGGFINAVLENDLRMAFALADEDARENIFEILKYLWNEVPATCWGSKEKISAWRMSKKEIYESKTN